jgi:hypothetical protein
MMEQINNQIAQIEQATAMLRQNPLSTLARALAIDRRSARAFRAACRARVPSRSIGDDLRTLYPETWEDFDLDRHVGSIGPLDGGKPRSA